MLSALHNHQHVVSSFVTFHFPTVALKIPEGQFSNIYGADMWSALEAAQASFSFPEYPKERLTSFPHPPDSPMKYLVYVVHSDIGRGQYRTLELPSTMCTIRQAQAALGMGSVTFAHFYADKMCCPGRYQDFQDDDMFPSSVDHPNGILLALVHPPDFCKEEYIYLHCIVQTSAWSEYLPPVLVKRNYYTAADVIHAIRSYDTDAPMDCKVAHQLLHIQGNHYRLYVKETSYRSITRSKWRWWELMPGEEDMLDVDVSLYSAHRVYLNMLRLDGTFEGLIALYKSTCQALSLVCSADVMYDAINETVTIKLYYPGYPHSYCEYYDKRAQELCAFGQYTHSENALRWIQHWWLYERTE